MRVVRCLKCGRLGIHLRRLRNCDCVQLISLISSIVARRAGKRSRSAILRRMACRRMPSAPDVAHLGRRETVGPIRIDIVASAVGQVSLAGAKIRLGWHAARQWSTC